MGVIGFSRGRAFRLCKRNSITYPNPYNACNSSLVHSSPGNPYTHNSSQPYSNSNFDA